MIYAVIILYVLIAWLWIGIYLSNKRISAAIMTLHKNQQNLKKRVK